MSDLFLLACSVCGQAATEQSNAAYVVMTLIMSLLPLGLIGGVIGWTVRRALPSRPEGVHPAPER